MGAAARKALTQEANIKEELQNALLAEPPVQLMAHLQCSPALSSSNDIRRFDCLEVLPVTEPEISESAILLQ